MQIGGNLVVGEKNSKHMADALRQHVGDWSSDHNKEARADHGWNGVAIDAIGRQMSRSHAHCWDDKDPNAREKRLYFKKKYGPQWKVMLTESGESNALNPSHLVHRLVNNPNPWQAGASFRWEFALQLRLHGSCLFWHRKSKQPSSITGKKFTVQRYVLPMAITQPVYRGEYDDIPNGGIRVIPTEMGLGWASNPILSHITGAIIPVEQLMIVRHPHPFLRSDGRSASDKAGWWIDSSHMVDMARWKQMKRGPKPYGIMSVTGDGWTTEEISAHEKRLNRELANERSDQKVRLVKDATFIADEATPREMDYVNSADQLMDATLAAHGLSRAAVGLVQNMTYGSVAAAMQSAGTNAVQPDLDLLAEEETAEFRNEIDPDVSVEYEVQPFDDPDQKRSDLQLMLDAGTALGHEWRAAQGKPPYGDWRDYARVTRQGFIDDREGPKPRTVAMGPSGMPGMVPGQQQPDPSRNGEWPDPNLGVFRSAMKTYAKGFSAKNLQQGGRPSVAVDLDNTLADYDGTYDPEIIGLPREKEVQNVRMMHAAGIGIIIHTCRTDVELIAQWCHTHNVPYDKINEPIDDAMSGPGKVFADVYWDDRAITVSGQPQMDLEAIADRLPPSIETQRLQHRIDRKHGPDKIFVMLEIGGTTAALHAEERMALDGVIEAENDPHVTLLANIIGEPIEDVVRQVRLIDQMDIVFGDIDRFEQPEQDVLIYPVQGKQLQRDHDLLANSLPNSQTYSFSPHCTLAYVESDSNNTPRKGKLTGTAYRVTHAIVADKEQKIRVPLRQ